MTMTSVADTRLLLALQFPSDRTTGEKIRIFIQKEMTRGMASCFSSMDPCHLQTR